MTRRPGLCPGFQAAQTWAAPLSSLEVANPVSAGQDLGTPSAQVVPRPAPGAPGRTTWAGGGCVRSTPPPGSPDTPPCTPGPGGRVIPGRHATDCTGDCPGCQPCPGPHCPTCKKTHAQGSCASCLGSARTYLHTLAAMVRFLETEATRGRQAFHTHEDVPGGDALVMLVAAASLRGRTGQPVHLFTRYELPTDPHPPLDVLVFWEELWRRKTNAHTSLAPTMARVVDYLDDQLHLMAREELFPHLHKALKRAVHQTENVLHAGHRPQVSRVPCLECGTRVLKVWTDTERHDHWRCPTCGEQYDKGRYERALHQHLASKGAERYVPISDACAASGRSERTVRDWMRREVVDFTRDPASGRLLVWWPDVREMHLTTQTRTRTGG